MKIIETYLPLKRPSAGPFFKSILAEIYFTIYNKINTITLKGEPSEYPNVWPRGGVVSRAATSKPKEVTENQWEVHGNVATIDNLVL